MQMGAFLPVYWPDYGASTIRSAIEATALAAEELGYASIWANDHVIAPAHQADVGHIIEPLITLATLVHVVRRVRLGTSVLVLPQRQPILVAKQAAALDVLSGGRLLLGIGSGWLPEEFAWLGADFARRGSVTDEAIQVMRTLWQQPQASFQGRDVSFAEAVFFPKPVSAGPPIWIGGNSAAAIRRAARSGDAWVPFGPGLEQFRSGVMTLQRSSATPPLIAAHLRLHIGSGDAAARAHIAGSAQQMVQRLQEYRQAGLAYLICDFVAGNVDDLLRQMRVMAEQIAPQLRH